MEKWKPKLSGFLSEYRLRFFQLIPPPPFTKIFVEPRHWKKNADQTVEE